MVPRTLAKRTAFFAILWLVIVAVTIALANVVGGSRGERVIEVALWPLTTITHGMSRLVDIAEDQTAAEPASSDLSSGEVVVLGIMAVVLYMLIVVGVANVVARLTLRGGSSARVTRASEERC